MSATITIELCAEDRARLDHINVNLTELILRVMGSQKVDMGEVLRRAAPVNACTNFFLWGGAGRLTFSGVSPTIDIT